MTATERGRRFRYEGYDIDRRSNSLTCHYSLDDRRFTELITFPGGGDWSSPAADAAARLVFLLAGVSYYKTGVPPVVDLGDHDLTTEERSFLTAYYLEGLGEFAYQNHLDLAGLELVGQGSPGAGRQPFGGKPDRPLVPFGGGLDSVVAVELVRPVADPSLFIVSPAGDRYEAIERAAKITELPVVRAERTIDPVVRRPAHETGFFNGHVPITGILSAIAVLAAVLEGRGAVVMSNEWSASMGTVEVDGRWINHQYSKSLDFESRFRRVVQSSVAPDIEYFSRLRPHSELWIARRFADLGPYHLHFHSCNRAFASDPARRLDHWCAACPKCCFIDLILAPFLPEERLRQVFGGREPLGDPALQDEFERLIGTSPTAKPFECVGDVGECRAAVALAARRPDRTGFPLLRTLAEKVAAAGGVGDPERLLRPIGRHFVPDSYATDDLLV
jgi:UDP-N-acetyl-alpha-D-muramoyl-L-alanyl-L-glutamate epimerase